MTQPIIRITIFPQTDRSKSTIIDEQFNSEAEMQGEDICQVLSYYCIPTSKGETHKKEIIHALAVGDHEALYSLIEKTIQEVRK